MPCHSLGWFISKLIFHKRDSHVWISFTKLGFDAKDFSSLNIIIYFCDAVWGGFVTWKSACFRTLTNNFVCANCAPIYIQWKAVTQSLRKSDQISDTLVTRNMECVVRLCPPFHDDVIKWKHFPHYWPFVRGIQRPPVNSPHKGQWGGALMFSLISAWINGLVNNREAGDLRSIRVHYDVTVMLSGYSKA